MDNDSYNPVPQKDREYLDVILREASRNNWIVCLGWDDSGDGGYGWNR